MTVGGVGPVFLGTHTPRLDDKGRLALPAKFRTELAGGVVITKGQEHCLYGFPVDEFERVRRQLRESQSSARAARTWSRVFFASASHEVPDGQGRITVPATLRDYAGLAKDCTVIGANERIEIWDSAAWDAFLSGNEDAFADAEDEVVPGIL